METNYLDEAPQKEQPRPVFLVVLCVLSFISTGLGVASGLINFLIGPSSEEALIDGKVQLMESVNQLRDAGMHSLADVMEKLQWMTEDINQNFYLASSISLLVVALGLYSVVRMWKGYRLGFHLYIAYNLLAVVGMYAYVSPANIPSVLVVFNLTISALFVFLYSRNLHWIKK